MPALARLQPSNCANPVLDIFTHVGGVLVDISVLQFQIFEKVSDPLVPHQVYPPVVGTRQDVDVVNLCPLGQKLTTGHYVAIWTPPVDELVGTHEIRWFFKLTPSSPEQTMREEFEVLREVSGETAHGYVTVADMRAEGVPVTFTDDWIVGRIGLASRMVDRFTGQWFEPRVMTLHLDGRGGRALLLEVPVIAVASIKLEDATTGTLTNVALTGVKVYNRHLTEGLLRPDDRANPRIELVNAEDAEGIEWSVWPKGKQNVVVAGTFGYTDPDGSVNGKTPDLIKHATKLLVLRYLRPQYAATGGGSGAVVAGPIASESTRGQSVSYAQANSQGRSTVFTGDAEVDQILVSYMRVPTMRAV